MDFTTAYLKQNSIDRATAKDMLTSPLGKFLKVYLDIATPQAINGLLTSYSTEVAHTLRGELRTLTAISDLFKSIGMYADGMGEIAEQDPELTDIQSVDPGFVALKEPIILK
jgi:hypothetical protein